MRTNVVGRVRNINLPKSQGLLPLFEAIINSIDSIEDSGKNLNDSQIEIFIVRKPGLFTGNDNWNEELIGPISGFEIVDTGIGFNASNFESFNEADTLYKSTRGGKGVGRFTWLRAFERVEIESSFLTEEGIGHRSFEFVLADPDCIKNHSIESNFSNKEVKTIVRLIGYREEFEKYIPKTALSIAQRIVEHCLEYFVFTSMPHCILHDNTEGVSIDLDEVYDKFVAETQRETINLDKHELHLIHFYLHARADLKHHICYCANNRVVITENIGNKVHNLPSSIGLDGSEDEYIYAGYVSSPFLNSHINSQRTDFYFYPDEGIPIEGELTKGKIELEVLNSISRLLSQFTEVVRTQKIEQIRDHIYNKSPEYRYIIENHPDKLDKLPPDLTPEKIDLELYEIQRDIEIELKKERVNIIEGEGLVYDENSKEDVLNRFAKWWQETNEVGKANLAKYIILRKNTLDVMEKSLFTGDNGKYSREEILHEIIFPLRKTSEDIQYEQHNLWIIDEKLAYHRYLASDIKLNRNKKLESSFDSRPDLILFFDRAIAVVGEEQPYNSGIVIFEFKRPMRNDYNDDNNPVQQVYTYISEIREGKALTKDGRIINIPSSTPFYSYIICDVTETLKRQALFAGLRPTPDNCGFFGFNESLGTYIEISSFDKMLIDAKKRNRILFEKLNLPNKIL